MITAHSITVRTRGGREGREGKPCGAKISIEDQPREENPTVGRGEKALLKNKLESHDAPLTRGRIRRRSVTHLVVEKGSRRARASEATTRKKEEGGEERTAGWPRRRVLTHV